MKYAGRKHRLPLVKPGLHLPRNDLSSLSPLMRDIRNCDPFSLGIGRREGTYKYPSIGVFADGNGGFEEGDFTGYTKHDSVLGTVLVNEECSSLSGYTINSVTVEDNNPSGQFRLSGSNPNVHKDWGSFQDNYTFEIRFILDSAVVSAGPRFVIHGPTYQLDLEYYLGSGLSIIKSGGSTWAAIGQIDNSWATWKFVVYAGGTKVDVYKDDVLLNSNIDCNDSTVTDGKTVFLTCGAAGTHEYHIDWYKIYDPVLSGTYSSKLAAVGSAINGCISDALTIDPNADYSIILYYYVTVYISGTAEIEMVFNDGSTTTVDIVSATATTSGWTELLYTFGPNGTTAIPVDATTVTFQQKWTGGSAEGTFFIDDITIPSSNSRVTGVKQFTSLNGVRRTLRSTADGVLWNGSATQIKTGLATRGDEVLAEGDVATVAKWTFANGFAHDAGNLELDYTGGASGGEATQTKSDLLIALKANIQYEATYTVSNIVGSPACNITTDIASITTALNLTAGTNTTIFTTNSNPGDFVLSSSSTAGNDFSLDDISLKEVVAYPVDISTYRNKAIFNNGRDVTQVYTGLRVLDYPNAAILGLVAETAGNVTNGKHKCIVTFINSNGETIGSPESIEVDVVDNTVEGQLSVTDIPLGPSEVTGRSLYMNEAGGTVFYKMTAGAGATLADNVTTTYTFNLADATLNTYNVLPTDNTATTGTTTFDLGIDGIARPTALTATPTGAGGSTNLGNGIYTYQTTFFNVHGETIGGVISEDATIVAATHDTMELTNIPLGPSGVTARGLYRTDVGASQHTLLTVIPDNTTTIYSDDKADGDLGDNVPTSNTAAARPNDWIDTKQPKYALNYSSGNTEGIIFYGVEGYLRTLYIVPDGSEDASQANIETFVIDTEDSTGIVGGIEYGSRLLFFSESDTWYIDKSDPDISNWTYHKAPWTGGTVNNRTVINVENDVFVVAKDGNVYTVSRVRNFGDYLTASLTRLSERNPFDVNRWIETYVDFTYKEDFHVEYHPTKQALYLWVVRKGQTFCDTALVYFLNINRWAIHDSIDNQTDSGFSASVSTVIEETDGTQVICVGDWYGNLWKLNQSSRNDNGNGYYSGFLTQVLVLPEKEDDEISLSALTEFNFQSGWIIQEAQAGQNLKVNVWVDGTELSEKTVSSTNRYVKFGIKRSGPNAQLQIYSEAANEDFFITSLGVWARFLGDKIV